MNGSYDLYFFPIPAHVCSLLSRPVARNEKASVLLDIPTIKNEMWCLPLISGQYSKSCRLELKLGRRQVFVGLRRLSDNFKVLLHWVNMDFGERSSSKMKARQKHADTTASFYAAPTMKPYQNYCVLAPQAKILNYLFETSENAEMSSKTQLSSPEFWRDCSPNSSC